MITKKKKYWWKLIFIFFSFYIAIVSEGFTRPKNDKDNKVPEIKFVALPSGTFLMGADIDPKYITAGENEGWRSIFIQDEFPRRKVKISHPFEISKYEITN